MQHRRAQAPQTSHIRLGTGGEAWRVSDERQWKFATCAGPRPVFLPIGLAARVRHRFASVALTWPLGARDPRRSARPWASVRTARLRFVVATFGLLGQLLLLPGVFLFRSIVRAPPPRDAL
eukprot:scaffold155_cov347-Pavlova_lutheri.AAC.79